MRILIIEDNKRTALALKTALKRLFAIDLAYSGEEGLTLSLATDYDAILLDLNLPDMPGDKVCAQLRACGHNLPILVITGNREVASKVSLLDIGADDYITKPLSSTEVVARIRAVTRRSKGGRPVGVLSWLDIELDPASRTVRRQNQSISLRRKEFDLLEYFMRNPGNTLTRAQILEHIWQNDENIWANVVDVHIKHLRDKIDRPFNSCLIQTVHGVGYKLQEANSGQEA